MKFFEKTTSAVIIIALIISLSVYGVWLDKTIFLAPLMMLVYVILVFWGIKIVLCRGRSHDASRATKDVPSDMDLQTSFSRPSDVYMAVPPGGIFLLLFLLFSAIMVPFSVIPYEAKISTLRLGLYVGVYWASANLFSRFLRRKTVWTILLLVLLLIALYSLVQHKVAPDRLFGMVRYTDYWKAGRLGGTYQCPNHIAHLFQMWIPFCIIFLFIPQFGWFWRICFGYALPVFVFLIYQTQSRAGLLGMMVSMGMLLLLLMLRKSRKTFAVALIVTPLLVAAGVGGLWAGSSVFRNRMLPVARFVEHVFSGKMVEEEFEDFRPQTWLDSLEMIEDRPLLGVGPGNYGQTFPEYRQRVFAVRMETEHPHNEPIELLAEYGLVGSFLFVGALVSICISLVRLIKTSYRLYHVLPAVALLAALAGTLVHGFFDFELRIFPNAFMLAVLAGCAVAPAMKSQLEGSRYYFYVRRVFVVVLVLTAFWSFQVMGSSRLCAWGDSLRQAGNRSKAMSLYKNSIAIDSQNWRAYLGLGQVLSHYRYYELDPEKKTALAQQECNVFAQAYRHNTKKEEVVYGLGRAELAAGNREEGLDFLRQAAHYKRFNDFYWRKLGIELRKAGLYEEAQETFLYAQKLDRSNQTVLRNIAWLKEQLSGANNAKR